MIARSSAGLPTRAMTSCVRRRDTRTRRGFDQEPAENQRPRDDDFGTPARRVRPGRRRRRRRAAARWGPMPTGGDAAHRATAPVRLTVPSSARTARSSRKSSWRLSSSTRRLARPDLVDGRTAVNHAASVSSPASVRARVRSARRARPARTDPDRARRDGRRESASHPCPVPAHRPSSRASPRWYSRCARCARSARFNTRACTTSSPPNAIAGTRVHASESADPGDGEPRHGDEGARQRAAARLEMTRCVRSSSSMRDGPQCPGAVSYSPRGSFTAFSRRARDRHVVIDGGPQLGDRNELVSRVRQIDGAGTKQQRLAPSREERNVGGVGEHRRRRSLEQSATGQAALRARARSPRAARAERSPARISRPVAHRSKHHLGLRPGRDDVRRHAARDEPDRVMRRAQHRIRRQLDRAQRHERVDQLVDGRFAELGKRRVRGAAGRAKLQSKNAARGESQPVVGRLAVNQEPGSVRRLVRDLRAVAAALFADHEQQADTRLARPAAGGPPPPPAPPGCPSHRRHRGRTTGRLPPGSEKRAGRSRNASRRRPMAWRSPRPWQPR